MPELSVKSQLGDQPPILWSQGGSTVSPIPQTPPSMVMPMAPNTHIQAMSRNPGLGLHQQDGSAWQPQTARSIPLQSNAQISPSYPDQFQPQIPSQTFRNNSYQVPNSSIPELVPGQIPVSFDPTQPTPASFGYQTWNGLFPEPSDQGISGTGPESMEGWYVDPHHFPRTREPQ
jgi:hypothetical protein